MGMKTCENCGSKVYSLGCVNCNEDAYIKDQEIAEDDEYKEEVLYVISKTHMGRRKPNGLGFSKYTPDGKTKLETIQLTSYNKEDYELFKIEDRLCDCNCSEIESDYPHTTGCCFLQFNNGICIVNEKAKTCMTNFSLRKR